MQRHARAWWSAAALLVVCGLGGAPGREPTAFAEEAPATKLSPAQLRELVGPVALYPDAVLSSLLPATTFPLDVVAAARWLDAQGGNAASVPEDRGWDGSVQALVQYPDVLKWLNENLEWMEQMGSAVATQQAEVLQAIQDFRRETKDAGNLSSGAQITVKEEPAPEAPAGTTVIVIQPTNPQVVYVPVYDPVVVTRPVYGTPRPLLDFTLGFAIGVAGAWAWHEIGWGWWDWHHHHGWHGGIYVHNEIHYWGHPRPPGWYAGPNRPGYWRPPPAYRPRPVPYGGYPVVRPSRPLPVYPAVRPGTPRPVVPPPATRPGYDRRPYTPSPTPTPLPAKPKYGKPGAVDPGYGKPPPVDPGYGKPSKPGGPLVAPQPVPAKGYDPSSQRGKESLHKTPPPTTQPVPHRKPTPTPQPVPQPVPQVPQVPKVKPAPQPVSPTKLHPTPPKDTRDWSNRGKQSKKKPQPGETPPPPPKKKH